MQTAKEKERMGCSPRKENGATAEEKRENNIAMNIVKAQKKCLSKTVSSAELATN